MIKLAPIIQIAKFLFEGLRKFGTPTMISDQKCCDEVRDEMMRIFFSVKTAPVCFTQSNPFTSVGPFTVHNAVMLKKMKDLP